MLWIKRSLRIIAVGTMLGLAATTWAGEVRLSAAASLKEGLNEVADAFCKENPEVKIIRNYGGSGALAKQIENGVEADIFIAANTEWLDYLASKQMVEGKGTTLLAKNVLVFAGPASSPAKSMADVAGLERIAIGSPNSVPAGEYAMQALKNTGVLPSVEKKMIQAKDVRAALLYAEQDEVDGAFVYRTDALLSKQVRILFVVPKELHSGIAYPMGMTATGIKNPEAKTFYQYLQSKKAGNILEKYGFVLP